MSYVREYVGGFRDRFATAADSSRVLGAVDRVGTALEPIGSTLSRWIGHSRIVRWFLAEPEPAVVVIDLRETYTVGPVIRALDWTLARAAWVAERTGVDAAADRTARRLAAEPLRVAGWLLVACAAVGLIAGLAAGNVSGGWLVLAGLGLLLSRERRSIAELADTRAGRALVAAFEPPEPPERDD